MIESDSCKYWLHGRCINLNQLDATEIETFICSKCSNLTKQTVYRARNNYHRHNFHELDADKKPVQAGTQAFLKNLSTKQYKNSEDLMLKLDGNQLKVEYFEKNGFNRPIFVENKDYLDFNIPSSNFNLNDIEQLLGSDYELEVIDVEKQKTFTMKMNLFKNYFNNSSNRRNKIYNLISLEISKTKLNEIVTVPKIVREISWVSNGILPEKLSKEIREDENQPDVHKYCLISSKNSYTDFHVDFGGSSVWYHIFKGGKTFYLIEPNETNINLFEKWSGMTNNTEILFSDQVSHCYCIELKEGNTIFLPSGYIHAVYTPSDSIVFGGNFLNSYCIPTQIKIYEMENRLKVPLKYKFPAFRVLHWYAGQHFAKQLKILNRKSIPIQENLYFGCKILKNTLKKWYSSKKQIIHDDTEEIPDTIQCDTVIRILTKELKKSKVLLSKKSTNEQVKRIKIKYETN